MTQLSMPKKTPYPLLSILYAIALLAYFYLQTQPDLQYVYTVPTALFATPIPELLLCGFAVVTWLELRHIQRRRRQQQEVINRVNEQIDELLENKKQLNAKAHVYANHADKLKLFISDKLLEYIEYDEKFLHFKSIASEVRHNGVISYDKVTSALEQQLASAEDNSDTYYALLDARDSIRYLWDLLDLSTADNIALHIANQVCEHEELLFQSELNDGDAALPEQPVFDPQRALERALARCFGSAPIRLQSDDDIDLLKIAEQDQVTIRCHPVTALLGNENHVVLALENIINNAQFFAGRRGSRRSEKRARIAVELDQRGGFIRYGIYNCGPHIDEEAAAKLFQLGYSTRRAKEHHGKGLGLYFVNEIIKGYDGQVAFTNIRNRADVLSLRLEMANGEVITDVIELLAEDDTPLCRRSGSDSASNSLDWELPGALASVEITHQSDQATYRCPAQILENDAIDDPSQPTMPRWRLTVDRSRKRSTQLHFRPLDIAGVRFEIKLPSLTARLEGDLLATDEDDMERQVAALSSRFRALDE